MEEYSEGRFLCYGDKILFETMDLEGSNLGAVLGVQELKHSYEFLSLKGELSRLSDSQHLKNSLDIASAQKFAKVLNDATRRRYFGFSIIQERDSQLLPPNDFFLNNIFEIVAGEGFEAAGEAVHYDSQVKLKVANTEEYLFVAKDQIGLFRKTDFETYRMKECIFKIRPSHKIRFEGEKVYYNDLVVLIDYNGRELAPIEQNKVAFCRGSGLNHGVRIGLYLPAVEFQKKGIYGGSIIQLFHRVGNSYLIATPASDDFEKMTVACQIEERTFLENSVSLWQIETIPSQVTGLSSGDKRLKANGNVFQATPIRLRHVMSGKLLYYTEQDGLAMTSELEYDSSIFELHINMDSLHEEETVGMSGLRITTETPVRLFHQESKRYVIFQKDAKTRTYTFATASRRFDKDVFQLYPVSASLVGTVLAAKRLRRGITVVGEKLASVMSNDFEREKIMEQASEFTSLCVGRGSFLSLSADSLSAAKEENSIAHLIANEFGFITVLLRIAELAFSRIMQERDNQQAICGLHGEHREVLRPEEEQLAKNAYKGIAAMLRSDSSSCLPILKSGAVRIMVEHFGIVHPDWSPPLIELAEAVTTEASKPNVAPVLVFQEAEVQLLLDHVRRQAAARELPSDYTYKLLGKACAGSCELVTNEFNGMSINKVQQMLIAEQLLGPPHETHLFHPHWLPLVFRPKLEEVQQEAERKTIPFCQRYLFKATFWGTDDNNSDDNSVDPWLTIEQLLMKEKESNLFVANLRLLSSLCIGRNLWCQRIVRKLYPVDHILVFLDQAAALQSKLKQPSHQMLLLSMRSWMLSLLHTCYIDSAFLPPLASFARQSILEIQTTLEKKDKDWEDVLHEECHTKIFGLFSQWDYEWLDLSPQMNLRDIALSVDNLPMDCPLLSRPEVVLPDFDRAVVKRDLLRLEKSSRSLLESSEDPDSVFTAKIGAIKDILNEQYLQQMIHSLEQRALLSKIMMDFVTTEALASWNEEVLLPIQSLISGKEQEIPVRTAIKKKSIHYHTQLIEGHFAMIKSLLIRGFFSYEYNSNPVFYDRQTRQTKPFYATCDNRSFCFQECLTYDERRIQVLACLERVKDCPKTLETRGDLFLVRKISEAFLLILNSASNQALPKSLCNMNEDEKAIDEYYNRLYGYSSEHYDLFSGMMKVRLCSCRALSAIIDVFQIKTQKQLEIVFNELFLELQTERLKGGSGGGGSSPGRHRAVALHPEELVKLQSKVHTLVSASHARNPDLIWNVNELFREGSFNTFIHRLLDNDVFLRSELLNLLYRINARRSEINELLFTKVKLYHEIYSPQVLYFARQRWRLQDLLARFTQCFDLTVPPLTPNGMVDQRIPIVTKKLCFYTVKLRQVLLNTNLAVGDLGLIAHCYTDSLGNRHEVESQLTLYCSMTEILPLTLNEENVKQMIAFELHSLVIDFILENEYSFNANSWLFRYYRDVAVDSSTTVLNEDFFPLLEVMRYLFLLLRSLVSSSVEVIKSILSKPLVSALFEIRYCVPEATDFLLELLERHSSEVISEYIEDRHFHSLFDDYKFVVQNSDRFLGRCKNPFGACSLDKMSRLIQLLLVGNARFTSHLIRTLNEVIKFEDDSDNKTVKQLVFQRILSLGLDLEAKTATPATMQTISHQFTDFDVQRSCFRYQFDTNRVTFCRLPVDILRDPPLDQNYYSDLKKHLKNWKLLPTDSLFRLHLDLVQWMARYLQLSSSLQDLYRSAFSKNVKFLFQILFIDKYEIKRAYLQLFTGIYFARKIDNQMMVPEELKKRKHHVWFKALLGTLRQDLRLFRFYLTDPDLQPQPQTETQTEPGPVPGATPVPAGAEPSKKQSQHQKQLRIHFDLHLSYVKEALLPFLLSFLQSNLCEYLINQPDFKDEGKGKDPDDETIASERGDPPPPPTFSMLSRSSSVAMHNTTAVDDSLRGIVGQLKDLVTEIAGLAPKEFFHDFDLKVLLTMIPTMRSVPRDRLITETDSFKRPTIAVPRSTETQDRIQVLKKLCLLEFIPEIDRLFTMYGFPSLEHLLTTSHRSSFFLFDKEYAHGLIPSISSMSFGLLDGSRKIEPSATAIHDHKDSRYHVLTNPLNCETFQFTVKVISRLLVAHSRFLYSSRFDRIVKLSNEIPNNQETEFIQFWNPHLEELANNFSVDRYFDKDTRRQRGALSRVIPFAGEGNQGLVADFAKFSEFQHLRWMKFGGTILGVILAHLDQSLLFYQQRQRLNHTSSFNLDDLTRCNAYWVHTFTKGILQSKSSYLFEKYSSQSEIQLQQLQVEEHRLSLVQDILCDLGAANLIVKQLSLPLSLLTRTVSHQSIDSIYAMAIEFGSALNEGGNKTAQNLFIDAIETETRESAEQGYNLSFVYVIRKRLQSFSLWFRSYDNVTPENVARVTSLLRFLQLLCERHNEKAQTYLGEQKIVIEVATLVNNISLLLEKELRSALLSNEALLPRDQPEILGFKRTVISWIQPLPDRFRLKRKKLGDGKEATSPGLMHRQSMGRTSFAHSPSSSNFQFNDQQSMRDSQKDLHPLQSLSQRLTSGEEAIQFLDLSRIQLLTELVTAGLEVLTEFCQGPRPEIQLMIARSGVTSDFNTFFEFFGALQLLTKADFDTKTTSQLRKLRHHFLEKVKCRSACGTLLEIGNHLDTAEDVYWVGNDPLALLMVLEAIHQDRNNAAATAGSDGGGLKTNKPLLNRGSLHRASSFVGHQTKHLEKNFFRFFQDDIFDLENRIKQKNFERRSHPLDLVDLDDWADEKDLYMECRKLRGKLSKKLVNNLYDDLESFEKEIVKLESSCLKLLSALIEAFTNVEKERLEIPKIILTDIKKENLVCNMANYWNRYLHYYNPISSHETVTADQSFERDLAYEYHIFLSRLLDLSAKEVTTNLSDLMNTWQQQSQVIVSQHLARIEVRSPNDNKSLVVAYFPVPPIVKNYWNKGEIEEFRDHILYPSAVGTRDSIDEKVKNFLKDGQLLILTLRHVESLDEIIAPISLFHRFVVALAHNYKRWNFGTFVLTIALNLLLLLSMKLNDDGSRYFVSSHRYEEIIYYTGLGHLFCTAMTFFSFMVMFGWLYIKMGLKSNESNEFVFHGYALSRTVYYANRCYLLGQWQSAELFGNRVTIRIWTITAALVHLLWHVDVLYFMALLLFSLLGNFVNILFFSLCLIEMLRLSKLMLYVTQAFTNNIGQVLATLALAAILFYLFSTLAFADPIIRNRYNLNGMGVDGCFSLESCFRLHLDYGLLQSVFWDYPVEIETWQGELFNFALTFIMQIVIPGLISGIIIDSFSQMRDEKESIEDDVQNTCFICNVDREDFESMNISFETHIKEEHNLWRYLWYIIYLSERDVTDFDGIELACHEIIDKGDFSTRWLPVKMARALVSLRDKYDLFTIFHKITTLNTMLEKFGANLKTDLQKNEKHRVEDFEELKKELSVIRTEVGGLTKKMEGKKRV